MWIAHRRSYVRSWSLTLLVSFLAWPAKELKTAPIVLNFDDLEATPNSLTGANVPLTTRLSDGFLSQYGVIFKSETAPYVAVVKITTQAPSPPNAIGGVTAHDQIDYAVPIRVEFFVPGRPGVPATTDMVSLCVDRVGHGEPVSISAFSVDGTRLQTLSVVDRDGPCLSISVPGIHSVIIYGRFGTAFDDFTFNPPEPAKLSKYPCSFPLTATVDGDFSDDAWQVAPRYAHTNKLSAQALREGRVEADPSGDEDCSFAFAAIADQSYLYMAVWVRDDKMIYGEAPDCEVWSDDSIEIFIDADGNGGNIYDSKDAQVTIPLENLGGDPANPKICGIQHPAQGVKAAVVKTAEGWAVEAAIALAIPGKWSIVPDEGAGIGFEISVNDDDDGGEEDTVLLWSWADLGTAWHDPAVFGWLSFVRRTLSTEFFEDFTSPPDPGIWSLAGSAHYDNNTGSIVLTNALNWQAGALWWLMPVTLDKIKIEFTVEVSGGGVADGMTMFVIETDRPLGVGGSGSGLGIAGLPGRIFHVELDAWGHHSFDFEGANGVGSNHIGVGHSETGWPGPDLSPITQPSASTRLPFEMVDAGPITVCVQFDNGHVRVLVQNDAHMPVATRVIEADLDGWPGPFRGLLGFSGATGGGVNRHELHYVKIQSGEQAQTGNSLLVRVPNQDGVNPNVVLSSEARVAAFSFGLRLTGSCGSSWIERIVPGPDLPKAPEFWRTKEYEDGAAASVACLLTLQGAGPLINPGEGKRIATISLCGDPSASADCSVCFTGDLGDPPVLITLTKEGGETIVPETSCAAVKRGMTVCFRRGDANGDGRRDISDPVFVIAYLFAGQPARCLDAMDSNDDGAVDIADPIYQLSYLFIQGPEPGAPGPVVCGSDPTQDGLGCEKYEGCR